MTLAEARATAWTWIGKLGAGTRAVSPGPSSARHMWLNPSFEPIVATTSVSGSRPTPNRFSYLAATSRRRLWMPEATL